MRLELLGSNLMTKTLPEEPETRVSQPGFLEHLSNALQQVDQIQKDASLSGQMLALGDQDFLHNTVLAYEKANLALQLTIEIRNRLLEAYQEIMRIQM